MTVKESQSYTHTHSCKHTFHCTNPFYGKKEERERKRSRWNKQSRSEMHQVSMCKMRSDWRKPILSMITVQIINGSSNVASSSKSLYKMKCKTSVDSKHRRLQRQQQQQKQRQQLYSSLKQTYSYSCICFPDINFLCPIILVPSLLLSLSLSLCRCVCISMLHFVYRCILMRKTIWMYV